MPYDSQLLFEASILTERTECMRRAVYRHKVHSGASSEHRFSHEIWHFPAPGLISGKPKLATVSVRYGSVSDSGSG